jgi:hypothetical protein
VSHREVAGVMQKKDGVQVGWSTLRSRGSAGHLPL